MVEWTDVELSAITSLWGKIDVAEIGAQALSRLSIVYPWFQRYFQVFGNLSTNAATPSVAKHGRTVMGGLENAVKNMDNIKQTYAKTEPLRSSMWILTTSGYVLSEIVTFCVASKFGLQVFAPDVQMTWQKFLAVVVSALGKQYH
uniref:Globin domain-containing protein n=1 Tax=Oreochromis niloticus TaxID=8128 RepID=A0A669E6X3_ORENI